MKEHPGDAKFVNQNASAQVGGLFFVAKAHTGTQVLFIPYRGAGPAITDLLGQVDLLLVQGAVALPAGARRHRQGARQSVAGNALGLARRISRPLSNPAFPGSISRAGSACSRPRARRPTSSRSSTSPWCRKSLGDPTLCALTPRPRYCAARATDARRARQVRPRRNRKMVADHQGGNRGEKGAPQRGTHE